MVLICHRQQFVDWATDPDHGLDLRTWHSMVLQDRRRDPKCRLHQDTLSGRQREAILRRNCSV